MNKFGVIGSGIVGETLANGLLKRGHAVMRGSRDPEKLESWRKSAAGSASIGDFESAARFGDSIVLAVKGVGAEEAVTLCRPENLAGKTVIDTTNPLTETGPHNGVLSFFTGPNESLLERLQTLAPDAHFVKAFSSVGATRMVEPQLSVQPTMFICGNDAQAKAEVRALLEAFQWDTADMGVAEAARAIEPLCMLWCIPGFLENSWGHAFKLVRS